MKQIIIFLVITHFSIFNSFSQNTGSSVNNPSSLVGADTSRRVITTAVPFLTITPDARSAGMGDVGAAISPDVNATYWNPAKIAFINSDFGFSFSYTPWLGKIITDMDIIYLSGFYKIKKEEAIAVSMKYFDLGEIIFRENQNDEGLLFNPREFSFDATYSRMLSQQLGVGISARYIHSNLTGSFTSNGGSESQPGNSVSTDIGVYYNKNLITRSANSELSLAAVISNIGGKLTYSDENNKDFIPTNLRLGTAFTTNLDSYNTITFGIDLNKLLVPSPQFDNSEKDKSLLSGIFGSFSDAEGGFSEEIQEINVSLGTEYVYNDTFFARLGYFYNAEEKGDRKYLTLGLGFKYNVLGIDFAYIVPNERTHPLAETLRFSLIFDFNKKTNKEESVTD